MTHRNVETSNHRQSVTFSTYEIKKNNNSAKAKWAGPKNSTSRRTHSRNMTEQFKQLPMRAQDTGNWHMLVSKKHTRGSFDVYFLLLLSVFPLCLPSTPGISSILRFLWILDFVLSVSGFVHVDLTFVVLYLHSWPFDDTNPAQKCKRIPAKHFKVTFLGTIEVLWILWVMLL